jgi:fumarate hydratase class II
MYIAADTLAGVKTATALNRLRDATDRAAWQWADVVKIGRTHLEGATPLTVSQEWSGNIGT